MTYNRLILGNQSKIIKYIRILIEGVQVEGKQRDITKRACKVFVHKTRILLTSAQNEYDV